MTDLPVTLLQDLTCPKCGGVLQGVVLESRPPAATSFDRCLRKCMECKSVGASNGRDPNAVTYIFKNPTEAIPKECRSGAETVLRNALNERNRQSKLTRFGFMPTSEDAVTWVIFTHLLNAGLLSSALKGIGVERASEIKTQPRLLLWGVPIGSDNAGIELAARLRNLCLSLGENPLSLSEPDVVVELGDGTLVFIEVKHRSGNDYTPPDYKNWSRYLSDPNIGWSHDAIRESGCYELARNWRLVFGLSEGASFHLVNLGPPSLFSGREGERLNSFVTALGDSGQRGFHRATWKDMLEGVWSDSPEWLNNFCLEWGVAV